jgi:hypothetical protein
VAHRRRTTAAAVALPGADAKYERGHGPCLDAARTGTLTEIADARTDIRWPGYMSRAAEHGNLSSLSVPLAIDEDEQVSGALNIHAREPHAFDEDSRSAATGPGVDADHRKLRSVADDLVRTGELPPEEPAGTGELPGGRHPRPSVRMSGPAGRRAARPTAEDRGHRTVEW